MKNKSDNHLELARRIRAAGCPIHIKEDDDEARCIPSKELRVYLTGGVNESRAIDWSGGTAFVVYLVITIKVPNFAISAFGLELPWKNEYFYWLEDPLQMDGNSQCYRFGSRFLPEFERHQVINHSANVTRIFSAGQSLKGFLLGHGSEPIPEEFRHGMMAPVFVVVYDQQGREYRAPLELRVDRSLPPSRARRKGSLLDHPDPITRD